MLNTCVHMLLCYCSVCMHFCAHVLCHVHALKCIKLTPAGKRCRTALVGKRYTVHDVSMALKTQIYEVCTELQNLKDTNTQ